MERLMLLGAGLLGFGGVAAAAAGAHVNGDARLGVSVAMICMAHAPVLLVLSGRTGLMLRLSALLLFVGATLFSVDISMRVFDYGRLFPMAAPSGGTLMLAGWLAIALSALMPRSR